MSHHFCWKGYVYLAWKQEQATLGLTPWPLLDLAYLHHKAGYQHLLCLTPELPLGQAYYLAGNLARQEPVQPLTFKLGQADSLSGGAFPLVENLKLLFRKKVAARMDFLVHYLREKAERLLREEGIVPEWQQFAAAEASDVDLTAGGDWEPLVAMLTGRLLFPREILQARQENSGESWPPFRLKVLLQMVYLQGNCHLYPGIAYLGRGSYRCLRCGTSTNLAAINCLDCSGACVYCEECQSMGESRLCRPLYGIPRREAAAGPAVTPGGEAGAPPLLPRLNFNLTKAQQDAANEVLDFVIQSPKKEALVWAVCGAGKTEVTFAAIGRVLQQGGQVLFAIPRRDVVLDLLPRLEQAFPQVELAALYGGSLGKYSQAPLVVATTHQAIRFYRRFDLVVLDEVDAYPYRHNLMLRHAIDRARKEQAKIIYLTATPDRHLYRQGRQGKIPLIHIPARHHGYPVPEPELLVGSHCKIREDGRINFSSQLLSFIHQTIEGDLAQLFVFTPTIYLTQQVGQSLRERMKLPPFNDFAGDWVTYSHSQDPQREEKRRGFVEGRYPVLVSTTIMERGITVARANVLVLFANYAQVFDAGTLVQMAGRAGRSSYYPRGKVLFVGEQVSPAMEEAVARIKEQNQVARQRGYLRHDFLAWAGKSGG